MFEYLSIACLIFSVLIGILGAFAQGSKNYFIRIFVQSYIQFFRNTPPFVQLLFFYFALGLFTPTYSPDGWLELPIISNVGKGYGHLGSSLISNTSVYDSVRMRGGGSSFSNSVGKKKNYKQFYEISGLEVWKQVVTFQPKNINLA